MISRTLLTVAAIAAVIAAVGLAGAPGARAADIAYVATDVLNLRDAPSTDGDVLAELLWGEDLKVVAGPTEDGWYQVVNVDTTGWVAGEYLSWQPVGAYEGAVGSSSGR